MEIRSPADGFVFERNVSLGRAFRSTTRLYTLADLSLVWILADAFETHERLLRPGTRATISRPAFEGDLEGVVSDVLPSFDPGPRTLKVRLEGRTRASRCGRRCGRWAPAPTP